MYTQYLTTNKNKQKEIIKNAKLINNKKELYNYLISNTKKRNKSCYGDFTVIGQDGFSIVYINNIPHNMPHLGWVDIGENVWIGSHCTIDRGTLENTVIGDNVKIDNHVHIGHNCKIGNNVVIGAGAIIGGSTIIDANSIVYMGEIIPSHSHIYATQSNPNVCDSVPVMETKLIITDLDDTLWKGGIGDDGINGIKILDQHKKLQAKLKELSQKGVMLAIASKNEENIALDAIDNHPDMLLNREDFVTWRINWQNKADNIKSMLKQLNVTEKGLIFIDNNVLERKLIQNMLPDVSVITEEDTKRLSMYRVEQQRQKEKNKFKTAKEWIDSLQIEFNFRLMSKNEIRRVEQLFSRVNQMTNIDTKFNYDKINTLSSNIWVVALKINLVIMV